MCEIVCWDLTVGNVAKGVKMRRGDRKGQECVYMHEIQEGWRTQFTDIMPGKFHHISLFLHTQDSQWNHSKTQEDKGLVCPLFKTFYKIYPSLLLTQATRTYSGQWQAHPLSEMCFILEASSCCSQFHSNSMITLKAMQRKQPDPNCLTWHYTYQLLNVCHCLVRGE